MSALDSIAQERQRLAERLARIDADRTKLAEQLAELEAAERVLSRFTQTRPAGRRGRRAAAAPASAAAEPRRGRRGRRAAPQAASLSLGDVTLRAVGAHQNGISAEDIRKYLADQFSMQVRANHLGMALQRHRRAGHLEQRDLLWFSGQAGGEETVA